AGHQCKKCEANWSHHSAERARESGSGNQVKASKNQPVAMLLVLTAIVFALCLPAEAQQPGKIPHIGFLSLSGANQEAFRQGLRDLGYIEGKNIAIESRTAANRADRLSVL